jgi:hypothetical protein
LLFNSSDPAISLSFLSKNQLLKDREAATRFGGEQTMLQAKPSLNGDLAGQTAEENGNLSTSRRSIPSLYPASRKAKVIAKFQSRAPVIIGEATYTGMMAVEGGLCGQLGVNGGAVDVRQRTRSGYFGSGPELNGELIFKDILRVNGHIAGYVQSHEGTLIRWPAWMPMSKLPSQ